MHATIIKSTLTLPLKDVHYANAFNNVLSQLQTWEEEFGGGGEEFDVCFDQDIRHCEGRILGHVFRVLKKLESDGFVKLNWTYEHIRPEHIKNEEEWNSIDNRVKRLVKNGTLSLVPYKGHPYVLHPNSPK